MGKVKEIGTVDEVCGKYKRLGIKRMNESIKRNIAFDQYQRYETVSKLIELLRKDKQFHLLELGANEHKDLKMFFPNDQILFTDIKANGKDGK